MSKSPRIFFLDGGLGTTLADQYDCVFDDSTPLWSSQLLLSASGAEIIQKCHSAFVDAGADLITTATYQASARGFKESIFGIERIKATEEGSIACAVDRDELISRDLDSKTEMRQRETTIRETSNLSSVCVESLARNHMRNAVRLARLSFRGKKGTVVLGLGAAGACLKPSQEYTGDYAGSEVGTSLSSIRKWHSNRLRNFSVGDTTTPDEQFHGSSCWSEVDLISFETIPLVREIIAVREAMFEISHSSSLGKAAPKKDFWISCVFPGEGLCLPDGSSVLEVLRAMIGWHNGAALPMGVGINCTTVRKVGQLVGKYEAAIADMLAKGEIDQWPSLVVYPDGTDGEVYNTVTHEWEKKETSNAHNDSWDQELYKIVNKACHQGGWKSIYVGGCCKTNPDDIRKLRENWHFP